MSAIEQALRQIDLQRERQRSTAGVLPSLPIDMTTNEDRAPKSSGRRWWLLVMVLALLSVLLAVAAWFSFRPHDAKTAVNKASAAVADTLSLTAVVPAPEAPSAKPANVPAFQPDVASLPTPLPTVFPAAGDLPPRAAWLVQADQTWDSGAWDHAARLWIDGLRRTAPSTLALQIADFQTLEQAQRLHQTWSREWPVVILAQASPAGPRWMVLALPHATEVEAVQQQLSQTLGHSVAWASVVQWVTLTALGSPMTASLPATAPTVAIAPTAPTPAPKEPKPEKTQAVASTPVPHSASPVRAAAPQQPQTAVERPQVSRSSGAAPNDQARAVMATKAIDVDFAAVEQLLAKDEFEKALTAAEQLESYMGSSWRTRYLTGVALSGLSRWNEAATALTSARQKNPGHARVALYLAVALQETGDHAGAIDILLKATVTHPEVPELWLNLAHSLQAQGRADEAAQAYRRFLDLSVNRSDLSQQRSWVNKRLQKTS
jgi:tetratricopeptide (TPR) repeat protein